MRGSNSELFIRSSSKKQFRERASDARLSENCTLLISVPTGLKHTTLTKLD